MIMLVMMFAGTFAQVCLCLHKPSSQYFALKILAMQEVIKLKQVQHVKSEKKILQVKIMRNLRHDLSLFRKSSILS